MHGRSVEGQNGGGILISAQIELTELPVPNSELEYLLQETNLLHINLPLDSDC